MRRRRDRRKKLALVITPSQIVTASFATGISVPLFLVALSRGRFLVRDLEKRFRVSCTLAIVLWAGAMLSGDELWRFDTKAICDVVSGALIVSAFMFTTLIVWLVVALGVSSSLLVSLSANLSPVEIEPWLADYGDGFGVRDLFRDRLELLLRSRAAVLRQSTIALVRQARITVCLVEAAMFYFNFPKSIDR